MVRRSRTVEGEAVSLGETLEKAGLDHRFAKLLEQMPHKVVQADPRRPFREQGLQRDEVMFVRTGILSKFKTDGAGKRQIVALRFAGDGLLPREGAADYGVQAIVRSEVLVASVKDFDPIVDAHAELARFFWKRTERHMAIGYEWLLNCGRRDSTARVAHLLCETAARSNLNDDTRRMANPFTQQQIADITGQTSVNVNRVFADLEKQGLILRDGRDIIFCDWPEIRRVASFQPNYLQ